MVAVSSCAPWMRIKVFSRSIASRAESKVCKYAPHMDGSNAHFAPHMEGRHTDFAPHMEGRHSFRDQIIAKTTIFANFQRELFKTTNIFGVYMTYVTTFENTNILRESTLKNSK